MQKNNCTTLANRKGQLVDPWCTCDQKGVCLGCRIERAIKLDFGEIGYAHLVTHTCREEL